MSDNHKLMRDLISYAMHGTASKAVHLNVRAVEDAIVDELSKIPIVKKDHVF